MYETSNKVFNVQKVLMLKVCYFKTMIRLPKYNFQHFNFISFNILNI